MTVRYNNYMYTINIKNKKAIFLNSRSGVIYLTRIHFLLLPREKYHISPLASSSSIKEDNATD